MERKGWCCPVLLLWAGDGDAIHWLRAKHAPATHCGACIDSCGCMFACMYVCCDGMYVCMFVVMICMYVVCRFVLRDLICAYPATSNLCVL